MGFFAHGTKISIDSTDIGGLESIGLPEQSKDDVELTDHDSGGDRDYIPGLREGGTVSLEGNNLPGDAGQTALRTNYEADGATETFVITLPLDPAVTYTFDGYVNALGGDNPFDAEGSFTAMIKVTGTVTKATAGS